MKACSSLLHTVCMLVQEAPVSDGSSIVQLWWCVNGQMTACAIPQCIIVCKWPLQQAATLCVLYVDGGHVLGVGPTVLGWPCAGSGPNSAA
jgi:hypothetical protein